MVIPCFSNFFCRYAKPEISIGCVKAKSKILTFPNSEQVPDYLLRHFIRGMFDGDGCICRYWAKNIGKFRLFCSISSTLMFCESLGQILKKEIGINSKIKEDKRCHPLFRNIVINRENQIREFLDWIYKDSNIFLNRKHDKYLLIKSNST